jgi:hypothetical protein
VNRFWRRRGAKEEPAAALCPAASFTGWFGALFLTLGLFAAALAITLASVELGYAWRSVGWLTAIMTVCVIGFSVRHYMPLRQALDEPPPELPVEPFSFGPKVLLAFPYVAVCVGAGHVLADVVDISRAAIPAMFLGIGIANLLASAWIGLWQHRHGRRVLFDDAGDDGVRLYATG